MYTGDISVHVSEAARLVSWGHPCALKLLPGPVWGVPAVYPKHNLACFIILELEIWRLGIAFGCGIVPPEIRIVKH